MRSRARKFGTLLLLFWSIGGVGYSYGQSAKQQPAHETQDDRASHTVVESADDRIADYTWWLAVFTLVLASVSVFQVGFLIRADRTARTSADAAKKSADALLASERPFIGEIIRAQPVPDPVFVEIGSDRASLWIEISLSFKNYGRTPAVIDAIFADFRLSESDDELFAPLDAALSEQVIVSHGESNPIPFSGDVRLSRRQYGELLRGIRTTLLVGRVDYSDVFGVKHRHDFVHELRWRDRTFRRI